MRTTESTCLRDELCLCKEEEEDGQIVSLGDSRIERVRNRLDMYQGCIQRGGALGFPPPPQNQTICTTAHCEHHCMLV